MSFSLHEISFAQLIVPYLFKFYKLPIGHNTILMMLSIRDVKSVNLVRIRGCVIAFGGIFSIMAEREGFEPSRRCLGRLLALQASAFDHSATSPRRKNIELSVTIFRVSKNWRREWDLNPRSGSAPLRRFRVARLRPLGHLSAHDTQWSAQLRRLSTKGII